MHCQVDNNDLIRIVNVSSEAHRWRKGVIWDDLNMEKMDYDHGQAYTQSKVANIHHAMELAKRLKDSGILAFSLHPGMYIMECRQNIIFRTLLLFFCRFCGHGSL